MGGLCYAYAKLLGRDEWKWGVGALAIPFLTPLILAFVLPKPGSTAAEFHPEKLAPVPIKGAVGSFEDRFPLLERCLANQPEAIRNEQSAPFAPAVANFEFVLKVAPDALARFTEQAQLRKFLIWNNAGPNGAIARRRPGHC